jgi:hypothetical protein
MTRMWMQARRGGEQDHCRMRAAPGTAVLTGVALFVGQSQEVWVMLAETMTPLATV